MEKQKENKEVKQKSFIQILDSYDQEEYFIYLKSIIEDNEEINTNFDTIFDEMIKEKSKIVVIDSFIDTYTMNLYFLQKCFEQEWFELIEMQKEVIKCYILNLIRLLDKRKEFFVDDIDLIKHILEKAFEHFDVPNSKLIKKEFVEYIDEITVVE